MTAALIIIDMQVGSFEATPGPHDGEALVARLNELSARVRATGGRVVHVQHDGGRDDVHHPSRPGWALLPALVVAPGDEIVRKSSCDAFLHTRLDALLAETGAERLIITGNATDFCVDTTIRSALGRGWPTLVPADGHTTRDRPHLEATRIIEHHNAIWADFLAPNGGAEITTCEEVEL